MQAEKIYHDFVSSKNSTELWEKLHQILKPYGVTSIFYGVGHLPEQLKFDPNIKLFHFKTSFTAAETDNFSAEYKIEKDLAAIHCLRETSPFIWDVNSCWVSDEEREVRNANSAYWYDIKLVGVTLPFRFGDFGKGGFSFAMENSTSEHFDQQWPDLEAPFKLIVPSFDRAVRERFQDLVGLELTQREKDIVAWLSEGHSAKIVADKLGTKTNTVQNQIVNVRQKIGARNNVQLVSKAIAFNLF